MGHWADGELPTNVALGTGSLLTGEFAFRRYFSRLEDGLTIGRECTMHGTKFALGEAARVAIGDYCYFADAVLLAELEVRIGSFVVMGWNATIADTDFHPIAPAERVRDALACSPLGKHLTRPDIPRRPVVIGDDVWIGPNATVLKGVTIGDGAWIEPGALVTTDVPAGARVIGNPAQIVAGP